MNPEETSDLLVPQVQQLASGSGLAQTPADVELWGHLNSESEARTEVVSVQVRNGHGMQFEEAAWCS